MMRAWRSRRGGLVEGGEVDGRGREGIGVILGSFGAAGPVEADGIVARLGLALAVQASGLFFAAATASLLLLFSQAGSLSLPFDLAGFAGPGAVASA